MAIYDNRDSQSGDHTSRDAAGRDILNQGLSGDQLARVLEQQTEFLLSIVKAYEKQHREFVDEIKQLRKENDIYREGERNQRAARQETLDGELQRFRRWLVAVLLAVLFALLVEAWLVWDRVLAMSLFRIWAGGAVALASQLWRGR